MSKNSVGEKFVLQKLIDAQTLTKKIVKDVASKAFLGMTEADGIKLLNEEFKKYGDIKFWHPHKFRIGKNTLCAFKEESDHSVRLESKGHFFIDIGPVFFEHEGDYGETFIFGENKKAMDLKSISEDLFKLTHQEFINNHKSGKFLYEFLEKKCHEFNVSLNLQTLGHRVGDFPHHLFYRGKMSEVEEKIAPNVWVLEVQISDLDNSMGAFYEDIIWDK